MMVGMTSCLRGWDTELEPEFLTWATVTSNQPVILRADNGWQMEVLNATNRDTAIFKVGDRHYIEFTLGDTAVVNSGMYPIYVKGNLKAETKTFITLDNDTDDIYVPKPIIRLHAAIPSVGFLNCIVQSYASYAQDNTFDLVRYRMDEQNQPTDTVPVIHMTLMHNTSSIDYYYSKVSAWCFDLRSLASEFPQATSFKIRLTWSEDNQRQTYEVRYTPPSTQ